MHRADLGGTSDLDEGSDHEFERHVPLAMVALMECEGVDASNTGVAYGLWFAVAEVGGVTGPLVLGRVADTSAGFGGALVLVALVCVAMLVPIARLRRFTDTGLRR